MDETMMQYEYVRREGRCNMLDRHCVQIRANDLGFHALVVLADDRGQYVELLTEYERPDEDEYRAWVDGRVDDE